MSNIIHLRTQEEWRSIAATPYSSSSCHKEMTWIAVVADSFSLAQTPLFEYLTSQKKRGNVYFWDQIDSYESFKSRICSHTSPTSLSSSFPKISNNIRIRCTILWGKSDTRPLLKLHFCRTSYWNMAAEQIFYFSLVLIAKVDEILKISK